MGHVCVFMCVCVCVCVALSYMHTHTHKDFNSENTFPPSPSSPFAMAAASAVPTLAQYPVAGLQSKETTGAARLLVRVCVCVCV